MPDLKISDLPSQPIPNGATALVPFVEIVSGTKSNKVSTIQQLVTAGLQAGVTGVAPMGAISLTTPLAVTSGGTGSATPAGAQANLGLAIGVNVQAQSAALTQIAGDTWAGSTKITTVGTIGAGTWAGTPISIASGGTGATSAAAAVTALGLDFASANTPNRLVQRDASGNFSAGTITATLAGNAASATVATNAAGGAANQLHFQTGPNVSGFVTAGTAGQVLTVQASGAPGWSNASTLAAGSATLATTATNLAGGVPGAIPYQTNVGATGFSAAGTAGQILTSGGAGVPVWANPTTFTVGTATSATRLLGGSPNTIAYQTAIDTTAFVPAGTSGQVLTANASGVPTWVAQSSLNVGTATGVAGTQTANTVYAAPSGTNGTGSFRNLVDADLPATITKNTTGTASNVTGIVAIANGGTGATTAAAAAAALLPSQAGQAGRLLTTNGTSLSWAAASGSGTVTSVDVSGGTTGLAFTGGPVTASGTFTASGTLALTNGGTGATTAAAARTNLGLVPGTNVQTQNANLQAVADLTTAADQINYWTGSGTAAVTALTSWARSTVLSQTTNAGFLTAVGALPATNAILAGTTICTGQTNVNGTTFLGGVTSARPVSASFNYAAYSFNYGGTFEQDIWNCNFGATNSFSFKQMTSGTTHTDLLDLSTTAATFRVPIRSVGLGANLTPRGRLSLRSDDPLGQNPLSASSTVFYVPCDGDVVPLWDGGMWVPRTFTTISIPIGNLLATTGYDVFLYWSGTQVLVETVAWAAGVQWGTATQSPNAFASTRNTALAYQNGILVKSGDPTRRYVGGFHTIGNASTVAGSVQTADDLTRRLVFNYYNQVTKTFQRDGAADGPYTPPAANVWYPHVSKLNLCVHYFGGVNGSLSLNTAIVWNPTTANAPTIAYIGLMDHLGNVPVVSGNNTGSIANQFSGASATYQRGQVNGLIAFDPAVLTGGLNVQFRNSKLHGVCQC